MSNDPIADMLIRIKNAHMAGHKEVVMPHSKMKLAIAQVLEENKYVERVEVIEKAPQNEIKLVLRYVGSLPAITEVKRISKPGRRLYASVNEIPEALGGYGITIVSTNKGVVTGQVARQNNVGGEILCQIW